MTPAAAPLRETLAGVVGSLATLALMVSQALVAHAPLGAGGAASGLAATAVTCGLAAVAYAAFSRAALPAAGPSMTTSLILAGFFAGQMAAQPDAAWALAAGGLALMLSGLLQMAGAAFGLAPLVRQVPRPVLAGFINGVALLMAISQLPLLLGLPARTPMARWLSPDWQPGALALGLGTMALILLLDRRRPGLPWALLALVLGTVVHAGWLALWPGAALGAVVGPVPPALPQPLALAPLFQPDGWARLLVQGDAVVGTAVVLALLGSLESALNRQALDPLLQQRHDPRHELLAVGAANVLCGALAGLPAVAQLARAGAIHRAGGRGALAAAAGGLALLLVFVAAAPLVAPLPLPVLAAIVIVIAWGMLDRWTLRLLNPWKRGSHAAGLRGGLAVMALVCAVTLWRGFTVGVAAGVLLSMAVFIAMMNRSLLRTRADAAQRPSRRIYPAALEARLQPLRSAAVLWELEGALFFGNADRLQSLADTLQPGARVLVIDLRRVSSIDESGAAAMAALGQALARRGVPVLLAGLSPASAPAQALAVIADELPLWPDADRALEAAERRLLGAQADALLAPMAPADSLLLQGLPPAWQALVDARLQPLSLAAGQRLFSQGQAADALYLLSAGSVSIVDDDGRRLVSVSPGMMFGEAGLLHGGTRSAHAEADQPALVHRLSLQDLQALQQQQPELVAALYRNIAVYVSSRLRTVTGAWWASQA